MSIDIMPSAAFICKLKKLVIFSFDTSGVENQISYSIALIQLRFFFSPINSCKNRKQKKLFWSNYKRQYHVYKFSKSKAIFSPFHSYSYFSASKLNTLKHTFCNGIVGTSWYCPRIATYNTVNIWNKALMLQLRCHSFFNSV